jgi:N-acyl-L-homoserine lactone synthetase
MLKILCPDSPRDTQHLAEMHHLRYKKFFIELGWKEGLTIVNQFEFDCFDHGNTFYLVHTNDESDKVNALARLTPTIYPNLLMDIFKDNITLVEPERSCNVLEISRFCAESNTAPRNVMGQIIAGLLEIGLYYDINHYVSFSNTSIQPRSTRFGWPAQQTGDIVQIGKENAVSLKHDVRPEYYHAVYKGLALKRPILNEDELLRCPVKNIQSCRQHPKDVHT